MEYHVTYQSHDFLKTCTPALIMNSPVKGLKYIATREVTIVNRKLGNVLTCLPMSYCVAPHLGLPMGLVTAFLA